MTKNTDSYENLREEIVKFIIQRGWKQKLAKRGGGFEQSLLEHSINCLDVMLTMLPTLKARLKLSEEEEQALVLGISIHDVAKERDEWQAYILGTGEYTPHVIPDYTAEAVEELAAHLSFSGEGDAQAAANLHMHSVQTAARIFTESQRGGPRVILLHEIVDAVDSIASANGLLAARDALARSPLDDYFYCTYHIVHTRGVSTTLLHRGTQNAFEEAGWMPLLYYPTGTLYLRSGAEKPVPVTAEMAEAQLTATIKDLLLKKTESLPSLIVGKNITANFLPKPELFDYRYLEQYLAESALRVQRKKQETAKNAWKYINYRNLLEATENLDVARQASAASTSRLLKKVPKDYHHLIMAREQDLQEGESERARARMGVARPEMAIFKFFREATNLMDSDAINATQEAYNALFDSEVAFEALTSTSTLMPAKDQAFTVDFFWKLPLKRLADFLEQPELIHEGTVGTLDPDSRVNLLIQALTKLGSIGFEVMEKPPIIDNVARDIAMVLIGDLISPPAAIEEVQRYAAEQLEYYKEAKQNIRTIRKAPHMCPACNKPSRIAKRAFDDFVDNPGGFTGRKLAYAGKKKLTICMACYYERLLRQIILGRKAYDLIVMLPRMSLGHYGGNVLVKKLKELQQHALDIAGADTTDPNESLRLDMTWFVARQALASDFNRMSARDLIRLFTYRTKEEKVRKNLKKVVKEVQDFLGSKDLEEACDFWERDFANWTEVAQAIAYNKINDQYARTIRESVYGLRSPIEFVAQTPNLVLAPSSRPRVSDSSALVDSISDSDAKAALKQLLITLIFALGLECSVAILSDRENLDALIMDASGTAYVPPLASIRDLVAKSRPRTEQQQLSPAWLSQQEAMRWLQALASAVLLASEADYPPRNDLYQILTVRSKGTLLRRIEQKGGKMYSENWQHLEAIGEVLP